MGDKVNSNPFGNSSSSWDSPFKQLEDAKNSAMDAATGGAPVVQKGNPFGQDIGSAINEALGKADSQAMGQIYDQKDALAQQKKKELEQQQQATANQTNQNYLTEQAKQDQGVADADAFTQARNAARRARGTTLYGAYNG